jgi:hypothetical protein
VSKFHKHLFESSRRLLVVQGLVGESSIVVLGAVGHLIQPENDQNDSLLTYLLDTHVC